METDRFKRELYDLSIDPSEKNNLLSEHHEVADRLAAKITRIIRDGRSSEGEPSPNDTGWWSHLVWMEKW